MIWQLKNTAQHVFYYGKATEILPWENLSKGSDKSCGKINIFN